MNQKNEFKIIGNDRGMLLVVALLLISILVVVGSTAVMTTTTDMKISTNYRESVKALYDAEAGIHYTIGLLKSSAVTLPPLPSGTTTTPTITPPTGFSFNNITLVNLGSNQYRISAKGNAAVGAQKTLEAVFTMASILPGGADGALAMYGTGSVVALKGGGSGYNVDGHNYPVPDTFNCSGAGCRTNGSDTGIMPGLYSAALPTITGSTSLLGGNPPIQIGGTTLHTNQEWSDFADYIIANNLFVDADQAGSLGTRDAPQITRIVVGAGHQSVIAGNTAGAGILIIDNGGEFRLTGTSHFEGLVILRGSGILNGSGTASVFGSTITINHTAREVDLKGTVDILYSSQALANLNNIDSLRTVNLTSWKDTSL